MQNAKCMNMESNTLLSFAFSCVLRVSVVNSSL